MGKKVFIFGCSYSAQQHSVQRSWGQILQDDYGYEVSNYAIGGSGTDFATWKLFECISQNSISPEDIVIFQTSSFGRMNLQYQIYEKPATAVKYINEPETWSTDTDFVWFYENSDHIKWYLANRCWDLELVRHIAFLQLVKAWALANPEILVIALQLDVLHHNQNIGSLALSTPKPFSENNFLIPDIGLYPISIMESGLTYEQFTEFTNWDIRLNHLSLPNRLKLAEVLDQAIKTRDVSQITYDCFHKNIIGCIKNSEDLKKYVDQGALEDHVVSPDLWKKL